MPKNIWPKPFRYFENVQLFLITLCLVIAFAVSAIFFFLYQRTDNLLIERLREQAVTYTDLIKHAKEWNFDYGGVYVEKKDGTESNAYLKGLGINPDITAGGRVFTIRNHAIMIEEISRRSEVQDGVKFRIVSLRPIDPSNSPDDFEAGAIRRFEKGDKESFRVERHKGKPPLFRYLHPLYVERSCRECHRGRLFTLGSVLGAVSVSIPITAMDEETNTMKLFIILAALATIGLLVAITYFLTWRLVINLDDVQKRLKKLASTDELTGLKNRRTIMKRLEEEFKRAARQRTSLALISLDIDHFKKINDTYGHPFGDLVLKHVAERMAGVLRSYDSIGRIGGEEFIIIAPGSPATEAVALAERVARTVREELISDGATEVGVTVSAGVAALEKGDTDIEALLQRADTALYRAKHEGRNRVIAIEASP